MWILSAEEISLSKPIHCEDAVSAQSEDSSNVWKIPFRSWKHSCVLLQKGKVGGPSSHWGLGKQECKSRSLLEEEKGVCLGLIPGQEGGFTQCPEIKPLPRFWEPSPKAPWCHSNQFSSPPQSSHSCHRFHYFSDCISPFDIPEKKIYSLRVQGGWNPSF